MAKRKTANPSGSNKLPEMVRVWDPLVRIFHWLMVSLFTIAYFTGDEWEWLHEWSGYIIAGLVAFRVVWGLIGSEHARFKDFIYQPGTVIAFLFDSAQMRAKRYLGHNPAGGAMVIALLCAITVIVSTGHMMTMDSFWGTEWVEDVHKIAVNGTLALIALHIAGVLLASFEHKENLVKSMFTGKKRQD